MNNATPVSTKNVLGRRMVRYESLHDLLADAEKLASGDVRTLGNWTFGQILMHLAMSLNSSIDGTGFMLPAPICWLMSALMKRRFLTKPIPPGFTSPASFTPDPTSVSVGLEALRSAIGRQELESNRALHPAFGRISHHEWNEFNLRHSEMHMSFVVPSGR